MSLWEDNLFGFARKQDWLKIGSLVPTRPNDPIDKLFGDQRTNNITASWETLAAEYQIPTMAQFHGFDTEANTTVRFPVDNRTIEKGLIKVKINQSERLRQLKRSGVIGDNELYNYIIDDGARLADKVITRTKVAKNELMAFGKVTIKENNLDLTVDYGVGSDQTSFTIDLDGDDVLTQIQEIIDAALEKGVTINGILTSRKVLSKIRTNAAVQSAIHGVNSIGQIVSSRELEAFFESEFGIDTVITNDLKYGVEDGVDALGRPKVIQHRYFPDDKITFFATNPAGIMGTGLWGDTPEEEAARFYKGMTASANPYVYIMQWMETDPTVLWTKASGLFIPVLYNPYSLFIATVTSGNSLPDITVKPVAQTDSEYGVQVSTIQDANVAVLGNSAVIGTSKYMSASNAITDVWGKGNFIALKFESDNWNQYTSVKVGLEPSAGSGLAELIGEDDKSGVWKIADPATQKFVIVATNGVHTDKQELSLNGLTLEPAGA